MVCIDIDFPKEARKKSDIKTDIVCEDEMVIANSLLEGALAKVASFRVYINMAVVFEVTGRRAMFNSGCWMNGRCLKSIVRNWFSQILFQIHLPREGY